MAIFNSYVKLPEGSWDEPITCRVKVQLSWMYHIDNSPADKVDITGTWVASSDAPTLCHLGSGFTTTAICKLFGD